MSFKKKNHTKKYNQQFIGLQAEVRETKRFMMSKQPQQGVSSAAPAGSLAPTASELEPWANSSESRLKLLTRAVPNVVSFCLSASFQNKCH